MKPLIEFSIGDLSKVKAHVIGGKVLEWIRGMAY